MKTFKQIFMEKRLEFKLKYPEEALPYSLIEESVKEWLQRIHDDLPNHEGYDEIRTFMEDELWMN